MPMQKVPFYMDLGIRELRNCELFETITTVPILKVGRL